MKLRLDLSYDGSAFCGFQVQKNGDSVQSALCRALSTIFREDVPVSGCSRTDAGVHARHFVSHAVIGTDTLPENLLKSINALLPDAIAVHRIEVVGDDFHARYSAHAKTYRYYIFNAPYRAPLYAGRVLHVPKPLDIEAMRSAAEELIGTHDFKSFQSAGSKVTDSVRTITDCRILQDGELLYLTVTANGFLYRMVRNIAGTLIDIGHHKSTMTISEILQKRDRTYALRCAKPEGLYLWQVDYPEKGESE